MLKELQIFMPTGSQNSKTPAQFLPQQYSAESENAEFRDELLQNRKGVKKWHNTALSGPVLLLEQCNYPSGDEYLIAFTTKDIYYWDSGNEVFKYLTPIYNTGTVAVTNGSKIITGTDTVWKTGDNTKTGDYFRLGGLNGATPVWYEVDTVDTDTQITLKVAYAGSNASGEAYTIRKIFTGDRTDYWRFVKFPDADLGTVYVFTNGINQPIYWDGDTGNLAVSIANAPIGRYIGVLKGHIILGWIIESGTFTDLIRWCDNYDITTWTASNYLQMPEVPGEITGFAPIGDWLMIFRDGAHGILNYIGGKSVYEHEYLMKNLGTKSPSSICSTNNGVLWLGEDLKFHLYTGSKYELLADELSPVLNNLDPEHLNYVVSGYYPTKNQVRWAVPYGNPDDNNKVIMNDQFYGTWHPWVYANGDIICSFGKYLRLTDLYLDDAVYGEYYLDEIDGYLDDNFLLAGVSIPLMGGIDGYVYQADIGVDDDGSSFETTLIFKKFDCDKPSSKKRFFKLQPYVRAETLGNLYVSVKEDDKKTYSAEQAVNLIDDDNDVIKKMLTFNANGQTLQPKFRIPDPFQMLGFILHYSLRERMK